MQSRRDFFRNAGGLAALLAAVEKASAIDPPAESTYLDAEHVVVLMQENRSFDHAFGRLRGVRGFNDPRAVTLPDGNPVWRQTNAAGRTHAPFRLDIKNTRATWLGSLPHSWSDQTDARNHGNHDRWLDTKASHHADCAGMPLTMGYYDREDIPFYYALADAFTICDQHFCSSLTGTTPNRLYLWTGTNRERQEAQSPARVRNSEVDYGSTVSWKTFPERLEEAGVSWRIYQNELSQPTGLTKEEDAWLANYGDNPLEWFDQYRSDLHPAHLAYLERTGQAGAKASEGRGILHGKAFTTNAGDAGYRELETLTYCEGNAQREIRVPKGDTLHQFREDVEAGKLPAVTWLVPPQNYSDHPSAPWYGAWYVAEALNILTGRPDVWKKTIFILTYDENDGYFDHVPPFVAPDPSRPETGKASEGLDTGLDYLPLADDRKRAAEKDARGGPVGLGYRVPLVIASPWSRGGFVCSQVFDHTSVLQLLERVMQGKAAGGLRETNISPWRRAVCGDLSSAFRPARVQTNAGLRFPKKQAVLEGIYSAQFKPMPVGFESTTPARQEPGVRPACALPYEIYAEGRVSGDGKRLELTLEAGKAIFGAASAGVPFHVYTPGLYGGKPELRTRAYAAAAGTRVVDTWEMEGFADSLYSLRVCGPNGFFRDMAGDAQDPLLHVTCSYMKNGDIELRIANGGDRACTVQVKDLGYKSADRSCTAAPGSLQKVKLDLHRSFGWYDFTVQVAKHGNYMRRYAGRVETGKPGFSDPAMGGTA